VTRPRVAVVGAGLTALLTARSLDADTEVVLVPPPTAAGVDPPDADGPLELPLPVDHDAQRLATERLDELGLDGPASWWQPSGPVRVWLDERLGEVPAGLGVDAPVPLRTTASTRALSLAGLATLALGDVRPRRQVPGDRSVAELVDARLGVEVRDRLVAPWVAGPIGGEVAELSATCELPELWAARNGPLVAARRDPAPGSLRGVLTVPPGWPAVVERLEAVLSARTERTPLVAIGADAHGPVLRFDGRELPVDALVLAVPIEEALRLLTPTYPGVARELRGITHRRLAEVVLDHDADAVPAGADRGLLLVPPSQGRRMAWADHWPGQGDGPGPARVRTRVLLWSQTAAEGDGPGDDAALVREVDAELRRALGLRRPAARSVLRTWSVPHRTVGHPARLDRLVHQLDQVPPGLHLGGAALRGVGPAARLHDAGRLAHEVRWQLANRPRRPSQAGGVDTGSSSSGPS
jgi:oxygen-dependent protoporphyrinogen oxidase